MVFFPGDKETAMRSGDGMARQAEGESEPLMRGRVDQACGAAGDASTVLFFFLLYSPDRATFAISTVNSQKKKLYV